MEAKRSGKWILKTLLVAFLAFALQTATGCTMAVWKMRKEREAEIAKVSQVQFIVDVRSGWIAEDGTTRVCVAVTDDSVAKPKEMAIRVSHARLIGKTYGELYPTPQRIFDSEALTLYFYPLNSAENRCEPPAQSFQLPTHNLHLPFNYQDQVMEIIRAPEYNAFDNPTLFKIDFLGDSDGSQSTSHPVMLVFRPSSEAGNPEPFGIPGVFEPQSEAVNPYTLLLPPALLVDAAITIPLILIIDKCCPRCF